MTHETNRNKERRGIRNDVTCEYESMRGHENGPINGNFVFEDGDILRFLVNYRNRWKFFDHRIINQFIVFSYFFLFFFTFLFE